MPTISYAERATAAVSYSVHSGGFSLDAEGKFREDDRLGIRFSTLGEAQEFAAAWNRSASNYNSDAQKTLERCGTKYPVVREHYLKDGQEYAGRSWSAKLRFDADGRLLPAVWSEDQS